MLDKQLASRYLKPLKPIPTGIRKSGRPLDGIQCVLFDIYGTLLISAAGDIGLAYNDKDSDEKIADLIKKFEVPFDPSTLTASLKQAISAEQRAQKEKGILFPEVEIDRLWMQVLNQRRREVVRKFALEYELAVNPVYPMPHLKELLQACRSRKLKMGLISNAQFYTVELLQWVLGSTPEELGFHPDLIFLSYRLGQAKPSRELFRKAGEALKAMHIQKGATLFVGNDMLNDILPAQSIGFRTALFAGDKRSLRLRKDDIRCRTLRPDIVLTDLGQLFDFIT